VGSMGLCFVRAGGERLKELSGATLFHELDHSGEHEDLLAEPARELARICGLLGVRYNDAMLAYDRDTTYQAPDAALATQWRGRLSRRQVQRVEARVGPMLASRGYEPSGEPALAVGALERAWRTTGWGACASASAASARASSPPTSSPASFASHPWSGGSRRASTASRTGT